MSSFPRPRRLRSTGAIRDLVAETRFSTSQLILPAFVREGIAEPVPIHSMPGVSQHTIDSLLKGAEELLGSGVGTILLFGVTDEKDSDGSLACRQEFVLQRAIGALKRSFGDELTVMSDLCMDEYTTHGHCGVLDSLGRVDNDRTLLRYQELALSLAEAGVDFVAPSGMMDHQVAAIREALDGSGLVDTGILAYSAKYASALYGPFRDAVEVEIAGGGNRKAYQQDYRNRREALREIELDLEEGADMIMVKPASYYLDIIAAAREISDRPVAAYQVSGESSMIIAAAASGFLDRESVALESLAAIFRAGADLVLTYFAKEVKGWME